MEVNEKSTELFVPGRLCLFGEHSDWAGGHRRQNSEIEKGYAIVVPTNQGNYARIKKLSEPILVFKSSLAEPPLEVELREDKMLKIAEQGKLFSYVAGVAYRVVAEYKNRDGIGVWIDNYKMDLPVKKGLSSSASVCVLTARAFNKVFNLKLSHRGEMELAYRGEIKTPSRCGRLDQACAYDRPVLMTFDCDEVETEELKVGGELHFLIVDLKKEKDTQKILSALNEGFPFPRNELEKRKHQYLGGINKKIVFEAVRAIEEGEAERIGNLMFEAQEKFDEYLAPACHEELEAPKLHRVLTYSKIRPYVYGGKCVGSGGDGTAQFICKSGEVREELKSILEREFEVECLDLDLKEER